MPHEVPLVVRMFRQMAASCGSCTQALCQGRLSAPQPV